MKSVIGNLLDAASSGDLEKVKEILQTHYSMYRLSNWHTIKMPYSLQRDTSSTTYRWHTPMDMAVIHNHLEILKLLIDYGFEIRIDTDAFNYLEIATFHGNYEMVKTLFEAQDNFRQLISKRMLFHIVSNDLTDLLELCIQWGADLNITDRDGNPLLHHAQPLTAKILLSQPPLCPIAQ